MKHGDCLSLKQALNSAEFSQRPKISQTFTGCLQGVAAKLREITDIHKDSKGKRPHPGNEAQWPCAGIAIPPRDSTGACNAGGGSGAERMLAAELLSKMQTEVQIEVRYGAGHGNAMNVMCVQ